MSWGLSWIHGAAYVVESSSQENTKKKKTSLNFPVSVATILLHFQLDSYWTMGSICRQAGPITTQQLVPAHFRLIENMQNGNNCVLWKVVLSLL